MDSGREAVKPGANDISLFSGGKTSYVITIADDASPPERAAAEELSNCLQRMAGAKFAVVPADDAGGRPVIAVGAGAAKKLDASLQLEKSDLGEDGIVLKTIGQDIVLSGAMGAKRGTLYAVCEFLEKYCGVRWWTSKETFVPSVSDLRIPQIDVRYVPKLKYREQFYLDQNDPKNALFSVHQRDNGHFPSIPPELGGSYNIIGWCHTFHSLIPPARYFKDHPDWFGEIGGKRSDADGVQLCLTNEEMRRELTKNALAEIAKNPDAGIISISQVDYGKFCQCAKCRELEEREGSPSGPLIEFVNKVADDIRQKHPDFLVETLAYLETAKPPKNVRPRDNVLVRVCGYECSWAEPLAESNVPQNVAYRKQIEDWGAISRQIFVWDYVGLHAGFIQPHPNYHVLASNIRLYERNKAVGVFAQGDGGAPCGDLVELRAWLLAKLMWDSSLDENELIKEFTDGYYGKAGEKIRRIMHICSDAVKRSGVFIHTNRPTNTAIWIGIEDLNKIADLFAEGEALVKDDPEKIRRLRKSRFVWDYVWLARYYELKRDAEIKGLPFKGPADPAVARDAFLAAAKDYGLVWFAEGARFDSTAKALSMRFKKAPEIPEICASLAAKNWLDVQESNFMLFNLGRGVDYQEDPNASDGTAAVMPGNHKEWFIQYIMPEEMAKDGPWRCYVAARATAKKGKKAQGVALQLGLYNPKTNKNEVVINCGLEESSDGKYRIYDLGVNDMANGMNFWAAPVNNPDVENVFVDRLFFVKEVPKE